MRRDTIIGIGRSTWAPWKSARPSCEAFTFAGLQAKRVKKINCYHK
jgi:hypothetical protein